MGDIQEVAIFGKVSVSLTLILSFVNLSATVAPTSHLSAWFDSTTFQTTVKVASTTLPLL